jgi:hypothetical protein
VAFQPAAALKHTEAFRHGAWRPNDHTIVAAWVPVTRRASVLTRGIGLRLAACGRYIYGGPLLQANGNTSFWNMENEIIPPFAFATTDRTLTRDRALRLITNQFEDVNALLSGCAPHSATSTSLKLQLAWMNHIGNFCLFSGVACSFDGRQIIDEIAH